MGMDNPVEAGQSYRDTEAVGNVEVEQVFLDEDGEPQVRITVHAGREVDTLLVDGETFVERVENEELELTREPEYRRD
jgi:hypothetical protein